MNKRELKDYLREGGRLNVSTRKTISGELTSVYTCEDTRQEISTALVESLMRRGHLLLRRDQLMWASNTLIGSAHK